MSATKFHMCQSVRGAIRNWNARKWDEACSWIKKDDGTHCRCGEELEHIFHELLARGIEKIPCGECDNFDPIEGCRGHPVAEKTPS